MQLPQHPLEPEHYCVRSFRNRALNHRRSLWRRLTREWESVRWFEKSPDETEAERAAMDCLAGIAGGAARGDCAENLAPVHVRGNRRAAGHFAEHGGGPLPLRFAENQTPIGQELFMDENEMKSLESRLRSWRPRRPSATLKWRLFLARAASVPRMIRIGGLADADHGLRAADPAGPEFRKRRPRRRPPAAGHHGHDEQPKFRGVCHQPPVRAKQFVRLYF